MGVTHAVAVELVAVLVAVTDGQPRVLTTHESQALPAGPFEQQHRSLQTGLRAWVEEQTHHPLGYVEQLYTFADKDRVDESGAAKRVMSISYLGLTREADTDNTVQADWQNWYRYFPWEDHRTAATGAEAPGALLIKRMIAPALRHWAHAAPDRELRQYREQRALITFGLDGHSWNEDLVLQRYELLFEAGLVSEAARGPSRVGAIQSSDAGSADEAGVVVPGASMRHDHRRILATGIARLRAKIKYRPVVFELMPESGFTFLQLQQTVEALAGRSLHKQNFRRLIEQQELVEETGEVLAGRAGRPARLLRFKRGVMQERAIAGSKLPLARSV